MKSAVFSTVKWVEFFKGGEEYVTTELELQKFEGCKTNHWIYKRQKETVQEKHLNNSWWKVLLSKIISFYWITQVLGGKKKSEK